MKLALAQPGWSLMTATMLSCSILAQAETKHTAEEKGLRSIHSDVEAVLTFHNTTGKTVNIYWLDFAGNRVHYLTLADGDKVGQATYLTHPWLVTDENDNSLGLYYADGQPRTVAIAPHVSR